LLQIFFWKGGFSKLSLNIPLEVFDELTYNEKYMPRKKKSSHGKDLPNKLASNLEKTVLQYIAGKRYSPLTAPELANLLNILPAQTTI